MDRDELREYLAKRMAERDGPVDTEKAERKMAAIKRGMAVLDQLVDVLTIKGLVDADEGEAMLNKVRDLLVSLSKEQAAETLLAIDFLEMMSEPIQQLLKGSIIQQLLNVKVLN